MAGSANKQTSHEHVLRRPDGDQLVMRLVEFQTGDAHLRSGPLVERSRCSCSDPRRRPSWKCSVVRPTCRYGRDLRISGNALDDLPGLATEARQHEAGAYRPGLNRRYRMRLARILSVLAVLCG